jgi:hypothetical protein
MTAASKLARTIAVVGVLAVGTAVASAATAAADPPPPVPADPAAPAEPPDPGAPPSAMGTMDAILGQSTTSPAGFDLLLGQSPIPGVPGSQPVGISEVNTPSYLFGPNFKLSEQGQQSMYSNGPTDLNAPPPNGRIDAFQRAHGIWHEGMGRLDLGQLGQPLPGTAPPPGTNLPPGPEQFLPDPPPPPGAPPPPLPPGG